MASSISLVTMVILAVVLLSLGSAEGREKSLGTNGNTALNAPARHVERKAREGRSVKRQTAKGKRNSKKTQKSGRNGKRQTAKGKRNSKRNQKSGRSGKRQGAKGKRNQKSGKSGKRQTAKGKRNQKSGRKNHSRKTKLTVERTNNENSQSKIQPSRRAEEKFDHCDYLDLMEVGTRRADCGPGGKFLFKVGFLSHLFFSSKHSLFT